MAISELPFKLAVMFTDNSGRDVPKATTVNPITRSEIWSFLAKDEPPSTRKSAPLITRMKPTINSKTDKGNSHIYEN